MGPDDPNKVTTHKRALPPEKPQRGGRVREVECLVEVEALVMKVADHPGIVGKRRGHNPLGAGVVQEQVVHQCAEPTGDLMGG